MGLIKKVLVSIKTKFENKNPYYSLFLIALLSITILLIYFFISSNSKKAIYQTIKAQKGTIVSTVSTSGTVLNANTIEITTQASGVIQEVYVKENDYVKKGQKIGQVQLDTLGQQKNTSAWASYLAAKNALELAKINQYSLSSDMFAKWESFYNLSTNATYQNSDGSSNETNRTLPEFKISQNDWLASEAKYKNQQLAISQAQAAVQSVYTSYQLTSPIITSPIDGTINNITIVKGISLSSNNNSTNQTTNSSSKIAVINTENKPIITVNLTEIDVTKVKIGQKSTITLDSISNKTFTGKVMSIDRIGTISNNVVSYPCLIQLDTNSNDILSNMNVNANIILTQKHNIITIPSSTIQIQDEQPYIRILKNNAIKQVFIKTGISDNTNTEVLSGIKEGDQVVISTINNQQSSNTTSAFGVGSFGGMRIRSSGGIPERR